MELRELRVVVAVAEHASVTRAAAALHQSAGSISHTIAALEARLGVELFHRMPRGMALSAAGEALLGPARRTLREADAAVGAVNAVRGLVGGRLSLVASRVSTVPLAELMAAFTRLYPHVVLRVFEPDTEVGIARLLRSGECELGVMRTEGAPSDFEQFPITDDRTMVVLPAGHRLGDRSVLRMQDLAGERLVAPLPMSSTRLDFDEYFRLNGIEPWVVAEAGTHEMVLELVRCAVGCTLAPEPSVAQVLGRGAVAVVLEGAPTSHQVLVSRRGDHLTPAAAAFHELVVSRRAVE